jgi:superfamily I DNA and RNA helicase
MQFHPHEAFDSNRAQRHVWDNLKLAFPDDEGVAYYRYPIFARGTRRREPDILLLHPTLGLWVIECKGCRIENVAAIEGNCWVMANWHEENETPLAQAEDQMFAVKNRYDERRETRNVVACNFCVALPFVTRAQWQEKGFDRLTEGVVLLKEDLYPGAIRDTLARNAEGNAQKPLTPEQWQWATAVLRGELPSAPPRPVATGTPQDSPVRVIREIEVRLKVLDDDQQKVAHEIPDGPQRVRGLAGTGKTVLFARRTAKIHARHPEWRIAFVFFTKALYDQVRGLVEASYRDMTGEAPDWRKIDVLHAWGGTKTAGFYSTLARAAGVRPVTVAEVERQIGTRNPGQQFDYICGELEKATVPELYDAVLVDEGQDLPASFYRLALRSLKEPKRLFWAYDEAQGIGSLVVPSATMVFGERDGKPLVDLSGLYEGGIAKSHIFSRCYRTPELLLMAAHAVNMGLLRRDGPLQGLTTQAEWRALGYEVTGSFARVGEPVRLRRHPAARKHPIDTDAAVGQMAGPVLSLKTFGDGRAEREWVAEQVAADIERGLRPTDIMVTGPGGDEDKEHFGAIRAALEARHVKVWQPGADWTTTDFRRDGHVTVSGIFQAKGNEAYKVYATQMHYATRPLGWKQENELHKRNEAFVALTRARLWCVATGRDGPIFDELRRAVELAPELVFAAFNRRSLRRVTDEGGAEEGGQPPG